MISPLIFTLAYAMISFTFSIMSSQIYQTRQDAHYAGAAIKF